MPTPRKRRKSSASPYFLKLTGRERHILQGRWDAFALGKLTVTDSDVVYDETFIGVCSLFRTVDGLMVLGDYRARLSQTVTDCQCHIRWTCQGLEDVVWLRLPAFFFPTMMPTTRLSLLTNSSNILSDNMQRIFVCDLPTALFDILLVRELCALKCTCVCLCNHRAIRVKIGVRRFYNAYIRAMWNN